MTNRKSDWIALFVLLILFFHADVVFSEDIKSREEGKKYLSGVEILTGNGFGSLRSNQNYLLYPLFINFNFDLKNSIGRKFNKYPGLLQFALEPFYSYAWSPDTNMEIGNNFVIKAGILPQGMKFQPYIKLSAGLIYITQDTREQSTHFNFNEYAGLGAHYFFKKGVAFTLEYRYRHISNAGIKHPNTGINTNFNICGVSFLF